jgi:hypothetical protein
VRLRFSLIVLLAACQPLVEKFSSDRAPAALAFATNPAIYHRSVAIPPNVLTNAGGAATFGIAPPLPAGLIIDPQTGAISGTPQVVAPTASYTVMGTNSAGNAQLILSLEVSDTPPQLTFPAASYSFVLGRATLTVAPINSGGPITACVAQPALPSGLQIDATTCAIFGAATAVATAAPYTIIATYDGGTVSAQVTIAVVTEGGAAPFTYAIVSGAGSIDAQGIFSPGSVRGDTGVQVTDTNGDKSTATVKTFLPMVDDVVRAFAGTGGAFYLGGDFLHVNPEPAAAVVALDAQSGSPLLAFDTQQSFDGAATGAVADNTGLYVVGSFRKYRGQLAHGIVKLDPATGAPDGQFNSAGGFDESPTAIVADASALYVVGGFTGYAGAAAGGVVKIDKLSGAIDVGFTGNVNKGCFTCSVALQDGTLFLGTSLSGVTYNGKSGNLFAIDTATGANLPFAQVSGGLKLPVPFTTDSEGIFVFDGLQQKNRETRSRDRRSAPDLHADRGGHRQRATR